MTTAVMPMRMPRTVSAARVLLRAMAPSARRSAPRNVAITRASVREERHEPGAQRGVDDEAATQDAGGHERRRATRPRPPGRAARAWRATPRASRRAAERAPRGRPSSRRERRTRSAARRARGPRRADAKRAPTTASSTTLHASGTQTTCRPSDERVERRCRGTGRRSCRRTSRRRRREGDVVARPRVSASG